MPRDGSGTYTLPGGSTAVTGQTISSSSFNTLINDLESDANTARPVSAGGTGAASESAARTALDVPGKAAAETISGNWTISGNPAFTGSPDFSGVANAGTVRTDLGLAIGTDVQAFNDYLSDIAGITPTAGDLIYFDGTDFTNLGIGTARQGLVTNSGATAPEWYDLTSIGSEQATTSGTAIDITGFPAGANWVTLLFDEVSLTSNDNLLVQLGTSGGFVTTGYIGVGGAIVGASVGETSATNGVLLRVNSGTRSATGSVHFKRMNGDKWTCSYVVTGTTTGVFMGAARIDLGAEFTQIRLTRTGTNTFDNGAIAATWGF